ncbi:MAG: cellulose synthase [Rhodospirillales bacterium]|nr:cellulose synthase [Rhodospirillales bacterium]
MCNRCFLRALAALVVLAGSWPANAADPFARLRAQQSEIRRSVTLRELGMREPVVFTGYEGLRELFFAVPANVELLHPELRLTGSYLRPIPGRTSIAFEVEGRPGAAQLLDASSGTIDATIRPPLTPNAQGFVRASMRYGSITTDDSCDQRAVGNAVTIEPSSSFTYAIRASDLTELRTTWQALPWRTRLVLPTGALAPEQFEAAIRLALAVRGTGRQVDFAALPQRGDTVSAGDLDVPAELAAVPAFAAFAERRIDIVLDTQAKRAAYLVLQSMQGRAPGDVFFGRDWIARDLAPDLEALSAEIARAAPSLSSSYAQWLRDGTVVAGSERDNLATGRVLGAPALFVNASGSPVATAFFASDWRQLGNASSLSVRAVARQANDVDWIPLTRLGAAPAPKVVSLFDEWVLGFDATQLPPGKWPRTIELELNVAPDASRTDPVVAVTLNDNLLRAQKVEKSGDVVRVSARVPAYALGPANTLRVSVQRGALLGDCRTIQRGYPAQLLPTSRILLEADNFDDQFFGLAAGFAQRGVIAVPPRYLAQPLDALPFVVEMARALGFAPASARLLQSDGAFQPDAPFLAFDLPLPGTRREARFETGGLMVSDLDGSTLLDLGGTEQVALAQLVTSGERRGVAVDTMPGARLPAVTLPSLTRGRLAVVDRTGVLALVGEYDQSRSAVNREVMRLDAVLYRNREWMVAAAAVLAALVVMRAVRWLVMRRRRKNAPEAPRDVTGA